MKITVIGTGYVGLVTGACRADLSIMREAVISGGRNIFDSSASCDTGFDDAGIGRP